MLNNNLYNKELLLKKIPPNDIGINTVYDTHEKIKEIKKSEDIEKWKKIIDIILENLYNTTKDLTLSAYLLEALCKTYHLEGALNGLEIIFIIIENFPNAYSKDKLLIFDWINKNFSTWFDNFELLKNKIFKDYYQEIYTQKYSKSITHSENIDINNINYNLDLLNEILMYIKNINDHYSLISVRENINYFKFYFNHLKEIYNKKLENNISEKNDTNTEKNDTNIIVTEETKPLYKEQMYNNILELVNQYYDIDKNDIILFLLKKVLNLSKKKNTEMLNLIKNNSLCKLYEE
ncbi:hypothetical protein AB836_01515 [Rickettsiales bacterium (ex Bugula neritina AB1)]|nr:hypothetical protein AB836_01515 [Rickettsiales bacterium (ex Bugula neritina AB1)]